MRLYCILSVKANSLRHRLTKAVEKLLTIIMKQGYTYSVFNLVYETNVASCRIWDSLGFDRIGRVPQCGDLKGSPGTLIDSIVYGKDLRPSLTDEQRRDEINKSEVAQDAAVATIV